MRHKDYFADEVQRCLDQAEASFRTSSLNHDWPYWLRRAEVYAALALAAPERYVPGPDLGFADSASDSAGDAKWRDPQLARSGRV